METSIVNTRHILTGGIKEFLYFAEQVGKKPAWFSPIITKDDVANIPINSTVILYGTYHTSKLYALVQRAWDENLISTRVVTPDEITIKHYDRR